jgi:L-threonylcarbamoyladenylate synthase
LDTPRIVSVDPVRPDEGILRDAAAVLKRGGLVILPTETVYGIAADPRNGEAAARLCAAKRRPVQKPLARFVSGLDSILREGAEPGRSGRLLAAAFWPGPLTLVMRRADGWTGYRVPDHPVPLGLLKQVGGPLLVSSANPSGERETRTAREAAAAFGDRVEWVLDGGVAKGGIPSTVVRVTDPGVEILREGAIPERAVRMVLEQAE